MDVPKDDLGHAQSGKLTGGGKPNRAATLEKKREGKIEYSNLFILIDLIVDL